MLEQIFVDCVFEVWLTISAEPGPKVKLGVAHTTAIRVREAQIANVGLLSRRELHVRRIDFLFKAFESNQRLVRVTVLQ